MSNNRRIAEQRRYEHDGEIYIFRDVWGEGSPRAPGLHLIRCEYKVKTDDGDAWRPCREGARFSEVEPYEQVD